MRRRAVPDRHRWGPLALVAAVLIALAGAGVLITGGDDPGTAGRADARRAHCLAAKNRPRLVEAAISLDVATSTSTVQHFRLKSAPGTDLNLSAWSAAKGDFGKVCTAVVAATAKNLLEPPEQPWLKEFLTSPVLNLLLGALVAALFPWFTARNARRESLADAASASAAAYVTAAEAYLANLTRVSPEPSDQTTLNACKAALRSAVLRQSLSKRAKTDLIKRLTEAHRLTVGSLKTESAEALNALADLQIALSRPGQGRSGRTPEDAAQ